ncbi:MAG: helix-turn-helix domain-containing protein [Lachnospiraceae bacterium]|jgi:transcriptional regulator with XRE-family HTH domain|nr:helix-turn-helix domain-containing protein [Lachnospiraceae bacterium]MCI8987584.1 helix-turn-helix domain-containing protein [Lachnospiraceae bacterium]MCI9014007.1 helix-turn-helix domain-containing protein [Lachnospiraceae bacterium]MCI9255843.1 helix-turn-helix domain-containing protein [Lachnospiraceae bacterium]
MKELKQLIRDLREDHDLTQREVAAYLGVSQQTYSNYENGVREIPTNTVVALARFYKVSTDYLLNSNSGYLGNTNLSSTYLDETTLHDIMYDIQGLDDDARKELLRFIRFLGHSE